MRARAVAPNQTPSPWFVSTVAGQATMHATVQHPRCLEVANSQEGVAEDMAEQVEEDNDQCKHHQRAKFPSKRGKSGWIREQVQRQSGATAGQWDVYFYPPGQQVKLRSRPEVRSYCENELNEPYVAADYDWKS
uniref:MBD domain-containing protein n=1 Tax=Strigamia maritima TaxID=126957 RepID=T1IRR2_STRMM